MKNWVSCKKRPNLSGLYCSWLVWLGVFISYNLAAQSNIDSIRTELNKPGITKKEKISNLNRLAAFLNKDSTNQALVYAHEAYLLSLNENDKKGQVNSLLNLSEGYLYNDIYDQALQYGYSALDLAVLLKDTLLLANCNTNLGWIFYDTENVNFSLQYHREAYGLFKQKGALKNVALSLNAIGLIFQMKNENDSAKAYFEQSLQLAREQDLRSVISAALNNLGICENVAGNYHAAIAYFHNALTMKSATADLLSIAEIENQMAFSYLKLKNYQRADSLLKSSRSLIDRSSSNSKKEKLLDNLHIASQLFEVLGDYAKAFANLKEYTNISNQIISRNKSDVLATLKLKKEAQAKEDQIKELHVQKELRSFQRNALAAGIVLLIIIGILLYGRLRQKQKRQKELDAVKQQLIKQELDSTLSEKATLNEKLEYKNADLKSYALFIAQRNEMISQFIGELKGMNISASLPKETSGELDKVIRKFQKNLDVNSETQDFNLSVDETLKDFFYNLLQKYPGLTDNERRLCAQIRLNLSIKEIASLNNISVKSVEMARYRLRKHFGLQSQDNLGDFLKTF